MTALRVRPAAGPDDRPGQGEAVWRLSRIPGMDTTEQYPGAAGSDLTLRRSRMVLTVTADDGRMLRAYFDPRTDHPIPESEDAPRDLMAAMRRAWRANRAGRPPGSGIVLSWSRLVDAVRVYNGIPTVEAIALELDVGQRTVERTAGLGPARDGGGGWDAVKAAAGRQ